MFCQQHRERELKWRETTLDLTWQFEWKVTKFTKNADKCRCRAHQMRLRLCSLSERSGLPWPIDNEHKGKNKIKLGAFNRVIITKWIMNLRKHSIAYDWWYWIVRFYSVYYPCCGRAVWVGCGGSLFVFVLKPQFKIHKQRTEGKQHILAVSFRRFFL